jgi:hypothetical protein
MASITHNSLARFCEFFAGIMQCILMPKTNFCVLFIIFFNTFNMVALWSVVFYDVTPYSFVGGYGHFGETLPPSSGLKCSLHLHRQTASKVDGEPQGKA